MGSKKKPAASAREYTHEAAVGVDRKRKKALLGRATTPVKVTRTTTVSELLDSYRDASFQARALFSEALLDGVLYRRADLDEVRRRHKLGFKGLSAHRYSSFPVLGIVTA